MRKRTRIMESEYFSTVSRTARGSRGSFGVEFRGLVGLFAFVIIALLAACGPLPAPVVPPAPTEGTPCERLFQRVHDLRCSEAQASKFIDTCERYEELSIEAPAMSWRPSCGAEQTSCNAIERCRSGEL